MLALERLLVLQLSASRALGNRIGEDLAAHKNLAEADLLERARTTTLLHSHAERVVCDLPEHGTSIGLTDRDLHMHAELKAYVDLLKTFKQVVAHLIPRVQRTRKL